MDGFDPQAASDTLAGMVKGLPAKADTGRYRLELMGLRMVKLNPDGGETSDVYEIRPQTWGSTEYGTCVAAQLAFAKAQKVFADEMLRLGVNRLLPAAAATAATGQTGPGGASGI